MIDEIIKVLNKLGYQYEKHLGDTISVVLPFLDKGRDYMGFYIPLIDSTGFQMTDDGEIDAEFAYNDCPFMETKTAIMLVKEIDERFEICKLSWNTNLGLAFSADLLDLSDQEKLSISIKEAICKYVQALIAFEALSRLKINILQDDRIYVH